jgi:hypothetical protein
MNIETINADDQRRESAKHWAKVLNGKYSNKEVRPHSPMSGVTKINEGDKVKVHHFEIEIGSWEGEWTFVIYLDAEEKQYVTCTEFDEVDPMEGLIAKK